MSEAPPEAPEGGGGGIMSRRIFGMPAIVVIGGTAVLAYFLFFRNKAAAGGSSSGGGGTPSTGDITVNPGSTSITVTNPVSNTSGKPPAPGGHHKHRTPNPQPRPKPPVRKKTTSRHTLNYTVRPGDTLAGIAKKFGVSLTSLAHSNVYVAGEAPGKKAGQMLGTGAGLKTGQVLHIPI